MSILGSTSTVPIKGFKLSAYENFLQNLQTPTDIEILLDNLTTSVMAHYPQVIERFANSIELLSCYTLFQWPVLRASIINNSSVGNLEKEGLVFLQPVHNSPGSFVCIVPFITLYWAIKTRMVVHIPFLKDIKSYYSSEESENNSLHIVMAKLWGLVQKYELKPDEDDLYTIWLSQLFPLRGSQADITIKFRPQFKIMNAPHRIDTSNYKTYEESTLDTECIAFLNAKGASFADAVIFSRPRIGIQEKQSVVAKKRNLNGQAPASFSDSSFQKERAKFPKDDIFVLITDEEIGAKNLGPLDVLIGCDDFAQFAGPLIALRKLNCTNELNESVKRIKIGHE